MTLGRLKVSDSENDAVIQVVKLSQVLKYICRAPFIIRIRKRKRRIERVYQQTYIGLVVGYTWCTLGASFFLSFLGPGYLFWGMMCMRYTGSSGAGLLRGQGFFSSVWMNEWTGCWKDYMHVFNGKINFIVFQFNSYIYHLFCITPWL